MLRSLGLIASAGAAVLAGLLLGVLVSKPPVAWDIEAITKCLVLIPITVFPILAILAPRATIRRSALLVAQHLCAAATAGAGLLFLWLGVLQTQAIVREAPHNCLLQIPAAISFLFMSALVLSGVIAVEASHVLGKKDRGEPSNN